MNGDLTRDSFDPRDGYTAVRAQQGRVMLDADHNEQADILLGDTRMGRRDLVGAARTAGRARLDEAMASSHHTWSREGLRGRDLQ